MDFEDTIKELYTKNAHEFIKELSVESKIKNQTDDPNSYDVKLSESRNINIKILYSQWRSMEDNRKGRKLYAPLTFIFVGCYISIVLLFFYWYEFKLIPFSDKIISENPIIALLTSTTANVITLLIIVMKYLFPKNKK